MHVFVVKLSQLYCPIFIAFLDSAKFDQNASVMSREKDSVQVCFFFIVVQSHVDSIS